MVIPREAGRITYSAEIRRLKTSLHLTEDQKAILIGMILGDGHLAENWSKTNYRLKVSQSKGQEKYVLWKYQAFRNWVLTEPKLHVSTNSMRFATISHPELTYFRNLFYKGKRKIIPINIGDLLSPLTLAVWFMDDGNIRKVAGKVYGYYLNTHSFSHLENKRLADNLKRNYGFNCMIIKNHGKYRIYIGSDRKKFADVVGNNILPTLRYKLG